MEKRNKMVCIMTLSLLSLCCVRPVSAQEALPQPMDPSTQKKGGVHVELGTTQGRLSREGVGFSLTYVAAMKEGGYQLTEDYSSANVNLNTIETAEGLQEAADTLQPLVRDTIQTKQISAQDIVNLADLEVGVRLLYVNDQMDYETIQPILISVPMWDKTARQINYHIEVFPKHAPLPALRAWKVDYYDHKSTLKEVAPTLYSDAACTKIIKAEKIDPKSGIAVFDGLIYGTVYVRETRAPAGYQLSKGIVKVTVNDNWVNGGDNLHTIVYANKPLVTSGGLDTGSHTSVVGWVTLLEVSTCTAFFLLRKKHEV